MYSPIINFIMFQVGWFACVLSASYGYPFLGSIIAVAIIGFHLFFASRWQRELLLVISAMVLGFIWDSYLVYQNWIAYPHGQLSQNTAPYWIVLLWGLFSMTLNISLKWLKNRIIYAIAFGAFGGPLAYFSGTRLGALEFIEPTSAIIALAVGWAIFTPVLLNVSNYLNGFRNLDQRSLA